MKRRQFLQGSLSFGALAMMSCARKGVEPPALTGSRKDPSYQHGHRLRLGDIPDSLDREESRAGLILGGGVSGLSAAWRWTRAGFHDFQLLELEPELGGNSRCLSYPASKAPIGAHYLPVPNVEARAVRRLLEEMGILREGKLDGQHLCHSRQERLFYKGRWHEGLVPREQLSPDSLEQFNDFQATMKGWKQKRDSEGRKIFALPLHHSSREGRELDKQTFADYVEQQGWDDPFLLWYLNYACRDDFGGTIHTCSAWAGIHYFASRDGGGLSDSDDILVWPEGNNRLVSHLQENQKGELLNGTLILQVRPVEEGVEVDYWDIEKSERVRVKSKVVCFCLPTYLRKYLLTDGAPDFSFEYAPWLTANLLLEESPRDLEGPGMIAWDNVIYGSPSLGYVVATHQNIQLDPRAPTVWTWYRPFCDRPPVEHRKELLEADWAKWSELVLSELEPLHKDIRSRCQRLDITILGHGMIRPSVDTIWGEAMELARRPLGAVFFGHGDLSGMSLFEESQFRGVFAAEQALEHIGMVSESFL